MIILQPVSSSESSSQKSMIIGSMTLLSIQFSLQYSFSILTTCSSAFFHTSFVIFPKAAYMSSLTSFNRKVVLFLATKPLTCAHINSIGLKGKFAKKNFFICFSRCINMDVYMYISVLLCWIRE